MLKKFKKEYFFLYFIFYISFFSYLEKKVTNFFPMNTDFDNSIPFCKYFIIPYLLWFLYVGFAYVFFYIKDEEIFVKMATFLTIGMTISLFICLIFPNGLINFRPKIENNDIFDYLVNFIYNVDTSTNVFPSIHVYNSIGVHIAICKYQNKYNKKYLSIFSFILMIFICLSTIFLKQHAISDVLGSILLSIIIYYISYHKISYYHLKYAKRTYCK